MVRIWRLPPLRVERRGWGGETGGRSRKILMPSLHLRRGKKIVGPFSPSKIKQMISDGKIKGTDLLRVEGDSDWIPAAEIPALRDLMQATEEAWVADDDAYDEVEYQASPRGVTEASRRLPGFGQNQQDPRLPQP